MPIPHGMTRGRGEERVISERSPMRATEGVTDVSAHSAISAVELGTSRCRRSAIQHRTSPMSRSECREPSTTLSPRHSEAMREAVERRESVPDCVRATQ
jgi:hypothetical protein